MICKGTTKAKGCGCGNNGVIVRFGLCPSCWSQWLLNTEEGKKVLEKGRIKGKKEVEKKNRAQIQKMKEQIETKPELERRLQPIINAIIRELDKDKGCVSCDHGWGESFTRQKHAGHRLSVGSSPHLRFNLDNIYAQCSICNNWKGGNERDYDQGLEERYGIDTLNKVKSLRAEFRDVSWTKEQLREIIPEAKKILRELKKGVKYSREDINRKLGIYENN